MKTRCLEVIVILAGALFLLFTPVPSQADSIYYFTSDHSSDGLGTAPFGEVKLVQNGSDIDVTVTLYDGSLFVRTGSGDQYDFKFNGMDNGIALGDINGSGLTIVSSASGPIDGDGTGLFDFGIYITGQGTHGASDGLPGPILFTVADANIADLIDPNAKGYIFVADIWSGQTGFTGPTDVTVPEPGILMLLGIAMGAVGIASRFAGKA